MRMLLKATVIVVLIASIFLFCPSVTVNSAEHAVVEVQIGTGDDDGTFFWNGDSWSQDGLGFTGLYTGYVDSGDYKEGVALRWASVAVPPRVAVSNCYISLCANNYLDSTRVNSIITGDKELQAASWTTIEDYQSRRGTIIGGSHNDKITQAQVTWNNIGTWDGDQWYNSPDISSIVQEIINQNGWQSGNPMALFWDDHAGLSTSVNGTYRGLYAYDADGSKAAKLHIEYATDEYSLKVTASGNGSLNPAPGTYQYPTGRVVSLNATADVGWTFSGWNGNVDSSGNTVTMDKDKTITAAFTHNYYGLTIKINGIGSVSGNNSSYHYGDPINLNASPTNGWSFSNWQSNNLDIKNASNSLLSSNMPLNPVIITANFISNTVNNGGGRVYTGGGGGSPAISYQPPPTPQPVLVSGLKKSVDLKLDDYGRVQNKVILKTDDGYLSFDIPQNTIMTDAQCVPLKSLSAKVLNSTPEAPLPDTILLAYDFGPEGAYINPPISMTVTYNALKLPEGTVIDTLTLAYWDKTQWNTVESRIDTKAGTCTCQVSHFSQWALMAQVITPAEPIPSPTLSLPAVLTPLPETPQTTVNTIAVTESKTAATSIIESSGNQEKVPLEETRVPGTTNPVVPQNIPNLWPMFIAILLLIAIILILVLVLKKRRTNIRL